MTTKINKDDFTPPQSPLAPATLRPVLFDLSSRFPPRTPTPPLSPPKAVLKDRVAPKRKRKPADDAVSRVVEGSPSFRASAPSVKRRPSFRASAPSSFTFSFPMPEPKCFTIEGQVRNMEKNKTAPQPPAKARSIPQFLKANSADPQIEFNSYIHPAIIEKENLRPLVGTGEPEGQYKEPYLMPSDPNKLVLIFKNNERNWCVEKIQENMKNSIAQYEAAKKAFGEDKCVTIYNATTVLEDKCFIVERIPLSFENVLIALQRKGLKPFESKEQLAGPLDDNQIVALDLLSQIRDFYNLSIEHKIDTDLHKGNFRVKIDASNKHKVILTDFRESIDDTDLIANKIKEFHELQRDLGELFKPKFLDYYFDYPEKRLL